MMPKLSRRGKWLLALAVGGIGLFAVGKLVMLNPDRNQRFAQCANHCMRLCYVVAEAARVEPDVLNSSAAEFEEASRRHGWDDGSIERKRERYSLSIMRLTVGGRDTVMLTVFDLNPDSSSRFALAEIDITNLSRITYKLFGPEPYRDHVIPEFAPIGRGEIASGVKTP